jgi:4-coumarate--CoA ligase
VSGVEVSAEDATAWVKERCAPYKWITGGVVFVDEIPRNLSGKILRKVLKERASLEVDVKAKL